MKNQIAQGAEAKLISKGDTLIKNRFAKSYRIKEIDEKIRRFRTKREAKVLKKLNDIKFPVPRLISTGEKESIEIEKINGKLIKEVLDKNYKKLAPEIGRKIAILHNNGIIHGDLTTSNMILSKELNFIDFGLSFFSEKAEDKAVDLHVLKEALESKHYKIGSKCFELVLIAYQKDAKDAKITLKRLDAVEKRGRYRAKKGS